MTTTAIGASAPVIFSFGPSAVRTVVRDGEPWFILSDLTAILGFSRGRDAARMLDDDEKGAHLLRTPGGYQEVTIVNESGVYALAIKSRRPDARQFRKWITGEVLPAIRKTGRYEPSKPTAPSFMNRRWLHTIDRAGREQATPLDPDDLLLKMDELPGLIRDPGFMVSGALLAEIVRACVDRLAGKLAGRATRSAS